MCCPNLMREVSSCRTRKLTQKPALDRAQKALACLVLNGMSLSDPFPLGSGNYVEMAGGKTVRGRSDGWR